MSCKTCEELFEALCDANINADNIFNEDKGVQLLFIKRLTDDIIKKHPKIMKEGNDKFDKMMAGSKNAEPITRKQNET